MNQSSNKQIKSIKEEIDLFTNYFHRNIIEDHESTYLCDQFIHGIIIKFITLIFDYLYL